MNETTLDDTHPATTSSLNSVSFSDQLSVTSDDKASVTSNDKGLLFTGYVKSDRPSSRASSTSSWASSTSSSSSYLRPIKHRDQYLVTSERFRHPDLNVRVEQHKRKVYNDHRSQFHRFENHFNEFFAGKSGGNSRKPKKGRRVDGGESKREDLLTLQDREKRIQRRLLPTETLNPKALA